MNNRLWLEHKWRNRIHTLALLSGLALMLAFSGWLLAGLFGMVLVLFVATSILLFSPRMSPMQILKMQKAQPLSHYQAGEIHHLATQLASKAGLKRAPKIFWIPSQGMNAFALRLGQGRFGIAITAGLLSRLTLRELYGVLAHEISHLQNQDTEVMHLAAVINHIVGTLSNFAKLLLFVNFGMMMFAGFTMNWIPLLLIAAAPLGSTLMQLALSRTREFNADLGAAALTGDPEGLASALTKLEHGERGFLQRLFLPQNQANSWLQTHPASAERIQRLRHLKIKPNPYGNDTVFDHGFQPSLGRFKVGSIRHFLT